MRQVYGGGVVSCRGAFGFRYKGNDLVTFNAYDSFPEDLGRKLMMDIRKYTTRQLKEAAGRIKLVRGSDYPSIEQRDEYRSFAGKDGDYTWGHLLWKTAERKTFASWVEEGLIYMVDSSSFLLDVWCDFAYIANLDTSMFETYARSGGAPRRGRYANVAGVLRDGTPLLWCDAITAIQIYCNPFRP